MVTTFKGEYTAIAEVVWVLVPLSTNLVSAVCSKKYLTVASLISAFLLVNECPSLFLIPLIIVLDWWVFIYWCGYETMFEFLT